MRFFDQVKIVVQSGKGGNGLAAARREAGVPFGGPSGGNGGQGGDVIFVGSKDLSTLVDFRMNKIYKADDGEPGRTKDQYGANADNIVLSVPLGTVIKDSVSGKALFQFLEDKQEYIIAKGGRGGTGNMHFKNSVNQYPDFALLGEPGQKKELILELQLLGDVGLIGTPSVGKSTLINAVSNVKAKTAEYHFTTLVPNLGSIKVGDYSFNMVDIPGLIQGASEGKGLGNQFLKHVLKSQIFALLVDISRFENGFSDLTDIIEEILLYIQKRFSGSEELGVPVDQIKFELGVTSNNHIKLAVIGTTATGEDVVLFEKLLHFVLSKYDLLQDDELLEEYKSALFDHVAKYLKDRFRFVFTKELYESAVFVVSAATHHNTDIWLHYLADLLKHEEVRHMTLLDHEELAKIVVEPVVDITESEKPLLIENGYLEEKVSKHTKVRLIDDYDFSRLTFITPWSNDEAVLRFWKVITREGYIRLLEKHHVVPGDVLKVKSHYAGEDDRYIMYGV